MTRIVLWALRPGGILRRGGGSIWPAAISGIGERVFPRKFFTFSHLDKRCFLLPPLTVGLLRQETTTTTTTPNHVKENKTHKKKKKKKKKTNTNKTTTVQDKTNNETENEPPPRFPNHVVQRTLQYIQKLGIGRRPRGRRRRPQRQRNDGSAVARRSDHLDLSHLSPEEEWNHLRGSKVTPPPPPFGTFWKDPSSVLPKPKKHQRGVRILKVYSSMEEMMQHLHVEKGRLVPNNTLPEVVLVGRSNVGKSTLLNSLLYGQQVPKQGASRGGSSVRYTKGPKAVMSRRPGETQTMTLYQLQGQLIVTDMPGYGFAHRGDYLDWICHYLQVSATLTRILLLVDAQWGLQGADRQFLQQLDNTAIPLQIVLTKCDLVAPRDLAHAMLQVRQDVTECQRRETTPLPVQLTSATRNHGILPLQRELASLVPAPPPPPEPNVKPSS